jgi:DNA segregation ATPase FtsK/SpoIIIE, S-DNA-T family
MMIDFRRMGLDLAALGLFAAVVFAGLSLVSFDPADPPSDLVYPLREEVTNVCGPAGAIFAHTALTLVGFGAYYLLIAGMLVDFRLFARTGQTDKTFRVIGWCVTLAALCAGLALFAPALGRLPIAGSGGRLGAALAALLSDYFSLGGGLILVAAAMAAGVILSGDSVVLLAVWKAIQLPFQAAISLVKWTIKLLTLPFVVMAWLLRRRQPTTDRAEEAEADEPVVIALPAEKAPAPEEVVAEEAAAEPRPLLRLFGRFSSDDSPAKTSSSEMAKDSPAVLPEPVAVPIRPLRVNPPATTVRAPHVKPVYQATDAGHPHDLPELDLLDDAEEFPYDLLAEKARIAAETLEQTFREFGLNVTVSEVDTGPVVTQFELNLEKGLRVSKVSALADDLAIALRVPAVRVVSPIPGKNTVGVEVPNEKQVMVRLRELIESSPEDAAKHRIPLFLGKDVAGRPLAVDLSKMPHLLIAGRTGTGKSVCLNTLIMSILMTRSPEDVRMLMIDPKMVELSPYKRIPHLMHPVITDMKKAEAVLGWAVDKMEERYDLLARCGVRHLDSYNKLSREERLDRMGLSELEEEAKSLPERMPYIVIIADEMADMMMTSGKDVEGHIIRLAQKSRAVGIHLVLATQKPTVDVITGLIKSNLPARICFQVSSKTDSRVVLDENGAERLLGNGDMLYLAPGTSNLIRAQGTYVSGDEVDRAIDFFSDCEPQYSEELARLNTAGAKAGAAGANRERDDMYDQAVEVVVREGRGSTSLLQRALGIGYGRAARLIDYMAEDGIVGDYNGSQAREVLYTPEQWAAIRGQSLVEA